MQPTRDRSLAHTSLIALAACAGSFAATLLLASSPASATETEASPFANLSIFARALSQSEASPV